MQRLIQVGQSPYPIVRAMSKAIHYLNFLLLCGIASLWAGCSLPFYDPWLALRLQRVELVGTDGERRPASGVIRIVDTLMRGSADDPGAAENSVGEYSDQYIRVNWSPYFMAPLTIIIENTSPSDLLVHWQGVRFTDPFGGEQRMVHTSVTAKSMDQPRSLNQIPTRIPSREEYRETLFEESSAVYIDRLHDWGGRRLMHCSVPGSVEYAEASRQAGAVLGKEISLLLPVEMEQQMRNYLFTFRIVDTLMMIYPASAMRECR